MSIGNLVANLTLSTAGFSAGAKQAQGTVTSLTNNINSGLSGIVGSLSPVAAAFSGAFAIGNAISGAKEAIAAQKKLQAVLTATQGAAGLTAEQISKYAGELQSVTNFEDDATISAAAMLATFTNIKGDQFKGTVKAAMDLSTVMKTDLNSSILMLGKVLNNPTAGMARLKKAGVDLTDQQKNQIKTMQAAGDMVGAQGVILKAFAGKMGDAAEESADPWKILLNTLGDVSENIGKGLLIPINALSQKVISLLSPLSNANDLLKNTGLVIADVIVGAGGYLAVMGALKVALIAYATYQRAATASAIFFQGAMNPALLAKVGVGIAAAGIAIASMDQVLAATGTSASATNAQMAALTAGIDGVAEVAGVADDSLDNMVAALNQWQAGGGAAGGGKLFASDQLFGDGLTKSQQEVQRLNVALQTVKAAAGFLGEARFAAFAGQITDQIGKVTGITDAIQAAKRELATFGQSDTQKARGEAVGKFAEAGATGKQLVEYDQLLGKIDLAKEAMDRLKDATKRDEEAASKITELKDELDLLRGVATETDIAMRQLGKEGFTAAQLAEIRTLTEQRNALLAEKKTEDAAAKSVAKGGNVGLSGAAEFGSAQAASIIANSVAKGRDPVADNTKKLVELQKQTLTAIKERPASTPLLAMAVLP